MLNQLATMQNVDYSHKFLSACDGCRKQKVKCDRLRPICSVCDRRGLSCTYSKPVARTSEASRFFTKTHQNLHLFKCVKEPHPPPKKIARIKSPTKGFASSILVSAPIPELTTDDSGFESNHSSSPHLPFHSELISPGGVVPTPLCSTLTLPKPNMESMISDCDRRLLMQFRNLFGLGSRKAEENHVIKSSLASINERQGRVSIQGLDFNPVYAQMESNFGALSSALEIHLINLFFNQVNTYFPLIHRGKFMASLKSHGTRPSNFLLNAIYFVACPFLPLNPMYFSGCHYKLAQHYHQEAMSYIEDNIKNPTITSLQAILLLYNGECSVVERLNKIQYGMIKHLDLDRLKGRVHSAEDREEVMNLLWCCYIQDKICNLTRCRNFSLPKSQFSLHLPEKLELPTVSEPFPLPGARHCQLAFLGAAKIAEVIDDVKVELTKSKTERPYVLCNLVKEFEVRLGRILMEVMPHFNPSRIDVHSAMALVILRLYFHMAHIHLYLFAASLLPRDHSDQIFYLRHRAMESACSITFLTESLQVDFFRFGPLLKVNSVLLAFIVHCIAAKTPNSSYSDLGGFGIERAVLTSMRNLSFRLGLVVSPPKAESLMIEFVTPPSTLPLRSD